MEVAIDARVLFQLFRGVPEQLDPALMSHLSVLTEKDWLLPSLNEVLVHLGEPVTLVGDVVRRNARAPTRWEFQFPVWALYQLSQDTD